jgi:predicted LPLAT superfamily acyltransferase
MLVVIPVYNHVSTLRSVVEKVLALNYQVLVVDDGSTDGALESLKGLDVLTLRHEVNQGKGQAILTGAAEAKRLGKKHIVTLDADGQHDPAEIAVFVEKIKTCPNSIIVGLRDMSVDNVPSSSKFGRSFSNFWYWVHTGQKLGDTHSGFRVYPVFIFEQLKFFSKRYAFEIEVLVRMNWAGAEVTEVPISVKYFEGDERVTHIKPFADNFRLTLINTVFTLRRLLFFWPHNKFEEVDEVDEKDEKKEWDSRSIGSDFQHQIFFSLIRYGGRRSAYCLLYFVTLWYVIFSKEIREGTYPYLSRRFPDQKRFWHSYRLVTEKGLMLVDQAVLGISGDESFKKDVDQLQAVKDLVAEGNGLILLMSHVGCWQLAVRGLGELETVASALYYQDPEDNELRYYEHRHEESPITFIDPLSDFGGSLEMLACLKRKEILCLMGDREFGDQKNTCEVNFLGAPVRLPITAYKMAALTGAPIQVIFTHKTAGDRYQFEVAKEIRVPEKTGMKAQDYAPYAKEYAETLEDFVEKHPYLYFNFYNIWVTAETEQQ